MKRSTRTAVDLLGGLLAERRKFEQWIAALEAKKDSTPKHVYERVHADYSARLEAVVAELNARSSELEGQREALQTRIHELEAEEQSRRDERAEAELRHVVGEYSPDQWNQFVRDNELALSKAGAERARLMAELDSLDRIIGVSGEVPVVPSPESAEKAADRAPAREPEADKAAARPAGKTPGKADSFDELAFLKSVVPDAPKTDGKPEAEAPERPKTMPESAPAVKRATPAVPAPAAAAPAAPAPPAEPKESALRSELKEPIKDMSALPEKSHRGSEQALTAVGDVDNLAEPRPDAPAFLKNVPQEAPKTLKCGECGAMNYATEWYCERCGAELAAL